MLSSVCEELLCQSYSAQIKEFLLPALAYGRHPFPFVDLLHTLLPLYWASSDSLLPTGHPAREPLKTAAERYSEISTQDVKKQPQVASKKTEKPQDKIQPTTYLLYGILHLSRQYIGQSSKLFNRYMHFCAKRCGEDAIKKKVFIFMNS